MISVPRKYFLKLLASVENFSVTFSNAADELNAFRTREGEKKKMFMLKAFQCAESRGVDGLSSLPVSAEHMAARGHAPAHQRPRVQRHQPGTGAQLS